MFIVFSGGNNFSPVRDIKLKFSAFLSCVAVTKCVKFQIPRYRGFKVGIFRISPIDKDHGYARSTLRMHSNWYQLRRINDHIVE